MSKDYFIYHTEDIGSTFESKRLSTGFSTRVIPMTITAPNSPRKEHRCLGRAIVHFCHA
jgi:hypothetical protein